MTRDSKRQLYLLQEQARRKAKNDYYSYVKYVHQDMNYQPNRLGELICNTIDDAIDKRHAMFNGEIPIENQYLIFSVPPQHGKSMHITETLPSYFMGHFPQDSVIVAGYNDEFACDFGKVNKQKIGLYGKEIFDISLDKNNQSSSKFGLDGTRGKALFAGIKGGITGKPSNLMIVDDPFKNRQEANSMTIRDSIWKEWKSTLSTRIHPGSIVIIIMTRWHSDDLVGRMFADDYGKSILPWNYINIPLLCEDEDTDPLGRKLDEQVFEGCTLRKTDIQVEDWKSDPELFNSLYQGHPTLAEGNIIKKTWMQQFYTELPPCNYYVMSVDATFKDTAKSDFVTIGIWGKHDSDYYLVDLINQRLSFTDTIQAIKVMKENHKDKQLHAIFIEDKANGSGIISILRNELDNVIGITPRDSKEARVWAITPILRSNSLYLPKYHSIIPEFINQCCAFPKVTHDDMVDNMSQALNELQDYNCYVPIKPIYQAGEETYESYEEKYEKYRDEAEDYGLGNESLMDSEDYM